MFLLKKLLSALLLPPVSLAALALFGLFIARRHPRAGRWLAGLSLLGLLTLSIPVVSVALMRSLETFPPATATALARVQAIVILGGGMRHGTPEYGGDTLDAYSLERVRYGVHLQKRTGLPILASGGAPFGGRPEAEAMKESIEEEFGGTVRWVESRSRDTTENARFSAAALSADGVSRIALVSHAWHLPRAIPLFERQGLEIVAAPTAFTTLPESRLAQWLPSARALAQSSAALREWLGKLFSD